MKEIEKIMLDLEIHLEDHTTVSIAEKYTECSAKKIEIHAKKWLIDVLIERETDALQDIAISGYLKHQNNINKRISELEKVKEGL